MFWWQNYKRTWSVLHGNDMIRNKDLEICEREDPNIYSHWKGFWYLTKMPDYTLEKGQHLQQISAG